MSDDDLASPLRKRKQRDDEDDGPSKKKIKISREYCREPGYYRCPGCENEDAVDIITRVPSLPGQGVCLNNKCYSSEILRNILMKNYNNTLNYNTMHFMEIGNSILYYIPHGHIHGHIH